MVRSLRELEIIKFIINHEKIFKIRFDRIWLICVLYILVKFHCY